MSEAGVPLGHFFAVATTLFGIGLYGALRRTNAIAILMSIELMLNAVNINLVAFSRHAATVEPVRGQVFAVFVMTLAAAEVAIGLAILLAVVRRRREIDINKFNIMKW